MKAAEIIEERNGKFYEVQIKIRDKHEMIYFTQGHMQKIVNFFHYDDE